MDVAVERIYELRINEAAEVHPLEGGEVSFIYYTGRLKNVESYNMSGEFIAIGPIFSLYDRGWIGK